MVSKLIEIKKIIHNSEFFSLFTEYFPKLGFNFPAKTRNAVVFPVPFEPTRPKTCPGRGVGKRCNLNELGP